jgi:hypothetical protein
MVGRQAEALLELSPFGGCDRGLEALPCSTLQVTPHQKGADGRQESNHQNEKCFHHPFILRDRTGNCQAS